MAHNDMYFDGQYHSSAVNTNELKLIKTAALRLLARREYSRLELFRKLSQKFSSGDQIQAILDELQEQGYQSDDRFTEMFIRSKVRAGNGPFKIKIELREKGICESTVLSAFDKQAIDWLSVAKKVNHKRFGRSQYQQDSELLDGEDIVTHSKSDLDAAFLAKQVRYLKNKGFYQEHIEEAILR